jgi:hypothetical protein
MDKKSSLFMTKKQEDTFGPEGSNPNPEIYKGIQENETSPLQVQAVASGYVSTRGSFQDMFDKISAGTVKAIEGLRDPETQAARLQDRIDSREARAYKKGKATTYKDDDDKSIDVQGDAERDKFDKKTAKLKTRQKTYQDRADADMQKRIEQSRALRGSKTYEQEIEEISRIYELENPGKTWSTASDFDKNLFMYNTGYRKVKPKQE